MRTFLTIFALACFSVTLWAFDNLVPQRRTYTAPPVGTRFAFQSVDTMKYSRDLAREKAADPSFDSMIDAQMAAIAATGATHVAIATPYDEEFLPMLWRWVAAARRHGLKVWFRGNLSGWEGWFGYQRIGRDEHTRKIDAFIFANRDLFEDGDAFSTCPECENGGSGDPRKTGDTAGFRNFLIREHDTVTADFAKLGKSVRTDLFSMNADVARLVMDKPTTRALGGTVTIDHYVKTPEQLASDVESIAKQSGGKVVLGEFGAPIPDIHGNMTEAQQADWVDRTLSLLERSKIVNGVNYWLAVGGSTEIWSKAGTEYEAVSVLRRHFSPTYAYGYVSDELGHPLPGASVSVGEDIVTTEKNGWFVLKLPSTSAVSLTVSASGYVTRAVPETSGSHEASVTLVREHPNLRLHILKLFKPLVDSFHKSQT
ncbi:MAG TPA: carboxypeptidase regulatory-like domain-containing protein [Candidatus Fimivivens sp.]|nr:carboxypeptidase regulatory-like domain-containing protein [Candidatus Fimivivens sp.]